MSEQFSLSKYDRELLASMGIAAKHSPTESYEELSRAIRAPGGQSGRLTAYDRRFLAAIGSTIHMLSWRDSEYYRLKDRISSGEAQSEFNEDLKSDWLKFAGRGKK